jgi:hypothetical protein
VNPYAVRYELARAWGYTLLSGGLWLIYWFHRNRKLLDGEIARGRDDAVVHSIGLFVPIWNVFVLYWLYRDLDELRRWYGLPELPVAAYVVGGALAPAIAYSIALGKVNEFWDVRTQGLAVEAETSPTERALLIVGAVFLFLSLLFYSILIVFFLAAGLLPYVV